MKISLVIRSRNDRSIIEPVLQALFAQKLDAELEFIHIDNASTDGTAEWIREHNPSAQFFSWPAGEYVPGKVLNFAVRQCSGEIIVFHNSDCLPLDEHYLDELTRPLRNAPPGVDRLVFANQHPRPNADPLVRKDYQRAFGDGRDSGNWRHFFSLAASGAAKTLLQREPFDETLQYSEDVEWSWRAKQHGAEIVYVPTANVEHSHNYTPEECAKRFFNEGVANARIFGDRPRFFSDFLLQLIRELLRDLIFLIHHRVFRDWWREFRFRLTQRWNLYRGARAKEFRK